MLEENQMQLMLFRAPPGGDVASVVPILLQYQLDACILASITESSKAIDILSRNNMPTVLVNRVPGRKHGSAVLADNVEGGRKAAEFFLDRGATKCSFIAGVEEASTSTDREEGFRTGLAERGLSLHSRATGFYTNKGGYEACRKLFATDDPPDAIFAANDIMGMGVMDAARDMGISIPDSLQIIGFDGIEQGAWASYSLSTIAISQEEYARRVVQAVLELIQRPNRPPETILMSCSLIERKSTRTL
jgi:DNA-binding LacI/PurR family transcriptional regulator